MIPTIEWRHDRVRMIDQRKLPSTVSWFTCRGYRDVIRGIREMVIRGAPAIGVADAVCDLVSSGSTLLSNGLREVETVFESSAQLVATPHLHASRKALLDRLLMRIQAVLRARTHKYILLNAPKDSLKDICRLLPGMKSPTVSYLNQPGWVSVQSVVAEEEFWEMVDRLHELGAEGILVLGLEKMVF